MCNTENTGKQVEVQNLVSEFQAGKVTRRVFLKRAAQLLGGIALGEALLLAASGASIQSVAEAAGALQGTAAPTPPATMAATPDGLAINTKMVTFSAYGQDAPGYLAQPTAKGNYPGVVVIQEWWGIDDHIKSVVERFARKGYVAVAPDLYRGKVAKEPGDAQKLVMAVQRDQALKDIQGAIDYLNQQDVVSPKKVGVIGFCFGGGLAMLTGLKGKGVGAVAVFYGTGVDPSDDDAKNAVAPIIGFYGDKDPGFTVDKINTWATRFQNAGKANEMHIYKGAAHAFFNDTRPSYVKDAADDSWQRTLAWFQKYLVTGDSSTAANATMSATQSATMAPTTSN